MAAALGGPLVFADRLPDGVQPIGLDPQDPVELAGKSGLRVLNDRLDDDVTPAERLFVRNNGHPPMFDEIDASTWTLQIAGEACSKPRTFTLAELRETFEEHTYQLTIECAGNGCAPTRRLADMWHCQQRGLHRLLRWRPPPVR